MSFLTKALFTQHDVIIQRKYAIYFFVGNLALACLAFFFTNRPFKILPFRAFYLNIKQEDHIATSYEVPNFFYTNSGIVPAGRYYIVFEAEPFLLNNRQYATGYSFEQLHSADPASIENISGCGSAAREVDTGRIMYPCGLMPRALLSDSFGITLKRDDSDHYEIIEIESHKEVISPERLWKGKFIKRTSVDDTRIYSWMQELLGKEIDDGLVINWLTQHFGKSASKVVGTFVLKQEYPCESLVLSVTSLQPTSFDSTKAVVIQHEKYVMVNTTLKCLMLVATLNFIAVVIFWRAKDSSIDALLQN